jgi:hypothetical protein
MGVGLCQKLAMAPTRSHKQQRKRKKWELAFVKSWQWCPPKPKQKKIKNKNRVLTLKLVLPNFSFLKLSTFQALSTLNPNTQLAGDGVTTRGVWEGWVGRMRGVDGLVGGRVVGRRSKRKNFGVRGCWRKINIKGKAQNFFLKLKK